MKKILFGLLMAVSFYSNAQEYKLEDKALSGVFEAQGKTKAQIYSAINKWISINYNSGKSVTQLSDGEGGNIVVKGINETKYKNTYKILYANSSFVPVDYPLLLNHLIEVNIKDNKYRITYRISNYEPAMPSVPYSLDKYAFDCINFNGSSDASILEYSNQVNSLLKMGLIGATKRATITALTKPSFDEFNANLVANIKTTMLSIQSAVTTPATDGW